MQELKIFEERQIRTVWDEVQEKWYFSIVDIVNVLTESKDHLTARKYWDKLKQRLLAEGNETVTNCHQLKMMSADGKRPVKIMRLDYSSDSQDNQALAKVKLLQDD